MVLEFTDSASDRSINTAHGKYAVLKNTDLPTVAISHNNHVVTLKILLHYFYYHYYHFIFFIYYYYHYYIRGVCVCFVISFMVFVMFFSKLN